MWYSTFVRLYFVSVPLDPVTSTFGEKHWVRLLPDVIKPFCETKRLDNRFCGRAVDIRYFTSNDEVGGSSPSAVFGQCSSVGRARFLVSLVAVF